MVSVARRRTGRGAGATARPGRGRRGWPKWIDSEADLTFDTMYQQKLRIYQHFCSSFIVSLHNFTISYMYKAASAYFRPLLICCNGIYIPEGGLNLA